MNKPLESSSALASLAVSRFTHETGIACTWSPNHAPDTEDPVVGHVHFTFPKGSPQYSAIIKPQVTRATVLLGLISQHESQEERLLITTRLTDEMATRCRERGVQFIDAAGNAYINNKAGLFVFVKGQQLPAESEANLFQEAKIESFATPAALRTIFSLLVQPGLLNAPIRAIAAAARVSVGSALASMRALRARGFVGTDGAGDTTFIDRHRLFLEWSSGYVNRLRPKLHTGRYAFEEDPTMYSEGWLPEGAAWGGEPAAAILTSHLKPASFTIYADISRPDVMAQIAKKLRIRADPKGSLEIVESFWGASLEIRTIVPPVLVFADLMLTTDPRNHDVAQLINGILRDNA